MSPATEESNGPWAELASLDTEQVDEFLARLDLGRITPPSPAERRRLRNASIRLALVPTAIAGLAALSVFGTCWWLRNGSAVLERGSRPEDQGSGVVFSLVLVVGAIASFILLRSLFPPSRGEIWKGALLRESDHPAFFRWMNGVSSALGVTPPARVRVVLGAELCVTSESWRQILGGRCTLWIGSGAIASLRLLHLTALFSSQLIQQAAAGGPRRASLCGRMEAWRQGVQGVADRSAESTSTSVSFLLARAIASPMLRSLERSASGSIEEFQVGGEGRAWDDYCAKFGQDVILESHQLLALSSESFERIWGSLYDLAPSFELPKDLGAAVHAGIDFEGLHGAGAEADGGSAGARAAALFNHWWALSEALTAELYLELFGDEEGYLDHETLE